jgi:ribosomal protein S18 acetylase RimI-like enzyme
VRRSFLTTLKSRCTGCLWLLRRSDPNPENNEAFITVGIQITVSSVGTAHLLKLPMRSIRKAVLEDISEWSHCDTEAGFANRNEFVERAIQRGEAYVLEQEGTVIGIAVLEYSFFEHGFISLIYVRPDVRRTGTGETLLRYLVSICQTSKLFSSTNQSNRPMQSLFAKAGFERSGTIYNLDPHDPEIVYYRRSKLEGSERK